MNSKDLKSNSVSKPFLKWAGGKTQLLKDLEKQLPKQIKETKKIINYVEPFIGGGAFFFYLKNYYKIENALISDINKEIIIGYIAIKKNHKELIIELKKIQDEYLIKPVIERNKYYYDLRTEYNQSIPLFDYSNYNESWVIRASQLIFLNKTCFNGLFRLNKKGEFNVPSGKYKNPKICDEENIIAINKVLQDTKILICDFAETKKYINNKTLVYLDPPYRPLNSSSSFTSYSKEGFNDKDQIRLSEFYKELDKIGAELILSNSDPENQNQDDDFFTKLYKQFNISKIEAKRMINCNAEKRGFVNELIISNH